MGVQKNQLSTEIAFQVVSVVSVALQKPVQIEWEDDDPEHENEKCLCLYWLGVLDELLIRYYPDKNTIYLHDLDFIQTCTIIGFASSIEGINIVDPNDEDDEDDEDEDEDDEDEDDEDEDDEDEDDEDEDDTRH